MDAIDTNIDNYSVDDLLVIFNLTEPNQFQVTDAANNLIAKMKIENKPQLIKFIEDRKGHDFRYSVDTTKIQKDLNFYIKSDFIKNMKVTIDWYKRNLPT